jgi:hypothetical protein
MSLETEIRSYEEMQGELERLYLGKYVVFYGTKLIGTFDNFELAAREAVRLFGQGPFLIREVGAPPMSFPASFSVRE